ncbi:F-box-like domain-containing protein [Purpureocillium lilacinum]|uniref:F-box-like domain-containing protein n=1 Tax=Purpureocillium lilacinum TaxID=33203 RepID=A0A179H415_PURLI|nr:F-box-like domain-containing protein [Purpureocillium lilacinum]
MDLPPELILQIGEHLPPHSRLLLSHTCSALHQAFGRKGGARLSREDHIEYLIGVAYDLPTKWVCVEFAVGVKALVDLYRMWHPERRPDTPNAGQRPGPGDAGQPPGRTTGGPPRSDTTTSDNPGSNGSRTDEEARPPGADAATSADSGTADAATQTLDAAAQPPGTDTTTSADSGTADAATQTQDDEATWTRERARVDDLEERIAWMSTILALAAD